MGPTFYEVETLGSGFLAVMAKPVAGEWIEDEFAGLAASGLHQVVSLLEPHEAFEVGLAEESALCDKHGLRFVSYPIADRGLPPDAASFAELTKRLHGEIAGGSSTVIHCRAGIGRAGLTAAGVLLHAGFEVDAAFRRVSACRGVEVPDTDEQRDWLEENAAAIAGSRFRFDRPRGSR